MKYFSFVMIAALAGAPLPAAAQSHPLFAGVWKMDPSRSESAHQAVPVGPSTLSIQQTDTEITIETRRTDRGKNSPSTELITYALNGSERANTSQSGAPVKSKAHWDGDRLVTETEREIQDATVTTSYILSLNAAGNELTIDKTLTIQHGYQSPGAKNTGTGRDVFVRPASAKK